MTANELEIKQKKLFRADKTRLIQRYLLTGNYKSFKREMMNRNNAKITEETVKDLWYTFCKKLNIPLSKKFI